MMSSMFISVGYFQCLINYQHIRYESNLVNFEILEGLNIDLGSSQPPSFIRPPRAPWGPLDSCLMIQIRSHNPTFFKKGRKKDDVL